jgi:hypothetical protein
MLNHQLALVAQQGCGGDHFRLRAVINRFGGGVLKHGMDLICDSFTNAIHSHLSRDIHPAGGLGHTDGLSAKSLRSDEIQP